MRATAIGCALTLLATIACSDSAITETETDGPDPLSVSVDPIALVMCEGHATSLSAAVSGDTSVTQRAVHFITRDSTVVTIREQYGFEAVLEGRKIGTTTVVATAVADPAAADSAVVTVDFCTAPTPTIYIAGLTVSGTSMPVDATSVSGTVDVHIEFDSVPTGSSARLLIDGQHFVDCGAVTSTAGALKCVVDTAARDTSGNPLIPNGSHAVSVRIIDSDGIVIASNQRTVTVHNP